jgi:hypothetical protein
MKAPRFSSLELRVEAGARREANEQLLRVPWERFRRAYQQYPRWQALALWGESACATSHEPPSCLSRTLKRFCPQFAEARSRSLPSEPFARQLLQWVHTRKFLRARREGWLDALIFYGVRHTLSRGAWEYAGYWETKWNRECPAPFPAFGQWWRSILRWPLSDRADCATIHAAVERYVAWEAVTLWLRSALSERCRLLPDALLEIERHCAGLGNVRDWPTRDDETGLALWRRIADAGNHRLLSQARLEGWVDELLKQSALHPWHVRTRAYATHSQTHRGRSRASSDPSFQQWSRAAARYVKAGPRAAHG